MVKSAFSIVVLFVLLTGLAVAVSRPEDARAAGTGMTLRNFAFNAGTNTVTWDYVFQNTDPANVTATVKDFGPAVTIVSTAPAGSCTGTILGLGASCVFPTGATLTVSVSQPYIRSCNATTFHFPGLNLLNWPVLGTIVLSGGTNYLNGANVSTPATVPADPTVCGTLIGTTYDSWGGSVAATGFSYNVATQTVTVTLGTRSNVETPAPGVNVSFNGLGVITIIAATGPSGAPCAGIPAVQTVVCTFPAPGLLSFTLTEVVAQQCTATVYQGPGSIIAILPGSGVDVTPGFSDPTFIIPANPALCPVTTGQPGAPTPTVTPALVLVPPSVLPQVFQNPSALGVVQAGNRSTPVPRAVAGAPSSAPAMPVVITPPSTGDAGLKADDQAAISP